MAPEVLWGENHSYTVDYYALGVMVYECMYGYRPYISKSKKGMRDIMISHAITVVESELPTGWGVDTCDFINGLLQRRAANRLGYGGISEIKGHKWLKDVNWRSILEKRSSAPFIPKRGDNIDMKSCMTENKGDHGNTLERYQKIIADENYESVFKEFDCDIKQIPEEIFKRKCSISELLKSKRNNNKVKLRNKVYIHDTFPETKHSIGLKKKANIYETLDKTKQRNLSQGDLSCSFVPSLSEKKYRGHQKNTSIDYDSISKDTLRLPLLNSKKSSMMLRNRKFILSRQTIQKKTKGYNPII